MFSSSGSTASIIIDISLLFIVLLTAVLCWRKGFVGSVFSFFRLIICVLGSFLLAAPLASFLSEHTAINASISEHMQIMLTSALVGGKFFTLIPIQLRDAYKEYTEDIASKLSASLGETLLMVFSFITIMIVLLIITKLLSHAMSGKKKDTPIALVNGFLGFLFGLLKGTLYVCVIMLLFTTAISFMDPDTSAPIVTVVRESHIASFFYDSNPLMMFLNSIRS